MGVITIGAEVSDFQVYLAAKRVADLVFTEFASPDVNRSDREMPWCEDRREEGVNPFYGQTKQGLFLEIYYSGPGHIWTPWGKWNCFGSGTGWEKERMARLLERLGATLYKEKVIDNMGEHGPIYAIHKVEGVALPMPEARDENSYLAYKVCEKDWKQLSRSYYKLSGKKEPMSIEEKFARQRAILEARGKKEPRTTPRDITDLEHLLPMAGQVIKYTQDDGKTWHYAKLWKRGPERFNNLSFGLATDEELLPPVNVHCRGSLTNKDFERGLRVRPTTNKEVKDMHFSYESLKGLN